MMKNLKKILFFGVFVFLFQGCVLNNFDNYRKELISLKIKPMLNNNHLEFSLKIDKYKILKDYSLTVIRVDMINSDCISYDLMWEYLVNPSLEKISTKDFISYGLKGKAKKLQKNTLYLTMVSIKKIDALVSKNMLPKISGKVLFYIDDFGKIISSTDSEKDRNNMCIKVKGIALKSI